MTKVDWTQFKKGTMLVNVLGIIYDKEHNKILIGRRENDPYIKNLTWSFPGGRPGYEDELEDYLRSAIKEKTNLETKIDKVVFSKTYPERREFLAVYYLVKIIGGKEEAGGSFKQLKWVSPEELEEYFTTSFHPILKKMLLDLKYKK
jgi:ADP-ribose pyrophosphatase YjhB (NUDIX family)